MSQFIQVHFLTSYGPANLNRDDLGRPKTAKMGGYDRLRISSQSLKRAWRTSDLFQEELSGRIGIRTKRLGVEVYEYFLKNEVPEKSAKEWAGVIAGVFGSPKKAIKDKPLNELEIEQLVHISNQEKKNVYALADTLIKEKRKPEENELDLLRKESVDVDIALFGRMLASKPSFNVEAAAQVAHAITVHRVVVEDDYFTAVDDLNTGEEDRGSAHIGEAGFGAGVFYNYICINRSQLAETLGDEELASGAIKALVSTAVQVAPSGKQNSFASRSRASYLLAEKGTQQPRQLTSAFLQPVDGTSFNADLMEESIKRIETLVENMDKIYGKCADTRSSFNVLSGTGTLDDVLRFVVE